MTWVSFVGNTLRSYECDVYLGQKRYNMKKILVIDGHPDSKRFCGTLAEQYALGAREAGAEVQVLHVQDMRFNPSLAHGFQQSSELEPDLRNFQQLLLWCEHLVVIYPTWWSGMPAQLKGLWDRAMLPGFAFQYRKGSALWDKLLKGRTARVITTMDTPKLIDKLFVRSLGLRQLKVGILQFCGFSPVKTTVIGSVRRLKPAQVQGWLEKVKALGKSLA